MDPLRKVRARQHLEELVQTTSNALEYATDGVGAASALAEMLGRYDPSYRSAHEILLMFATVERRLALLKEIMEQRLRSELPK